MTYTPDTIRTKIMREERVKLGQEFDRLAQSANPTLWAGYPFPSPDAASQAQARHRAIGVLLNVPWAGSITASRAAINTAVNVM